MNPTDVAAYGSLIVTTCGAIGLPLWVIKRKNTQAQTHAITMDSRAVAQMFRDERDALKVQLKDVTNDYERKLAALKDDYEQKLAVADARHQAQIAELKTEVDGLYKRLYSRGS